MKLQLKSPKFLFSFAGPFWPPGLVFYSVAIYTPFSIGGAFTDVKFLIP